MLTKAQRKRINARIAVLKQEHARLIKRRNDIFRTNESLAGTFGSEFRALDANSDEVLILYEAGEAMRKAGLLMAVLVDDVDVEAEWNIEQAKLLQVRKEIATLASTEKRILRTLKNLAFVKSVIK